MMLEQLDTHMQKELQSLPHTTKQTNKKLKMDHLIIKPNNYHNKTPGRNHKRKFFATLE